MTVAVRPLHLALFVGIMLIWGLNLVIAKIGLNHLPPLFFMALRFALVALLLVPFAKRPVRAWRKLLLISVTLGFLHFALMFTGLTQIDAATAAITVQLQVPFAAILAALFFGDRLGWRRALGLAIAFVGTGLIAGEPRIAGQYLHLAMVVGAAFFWAIANIQIKLLEDIDGLTLNAWVSIFAAPQLLLASALLEEGQIQAIKAADWIIVGAVVYQAVLVVCVGYGLWYWLLRQYALNQAMPFTLLVPVVGVVAGVLILGEPLTFALIAGGLLTIVGVGIIVLRRPKLARPETERV